MPSLNYPDVLGGLTGGERCAVGDIHAALAVRPRVVRAGHPFEVLMLIQSTADVPVDVVVNLHLPERDNDGKKGRFVSGTPRLVVGLEPGEVGYVTLPVSTMPDTAIARDYAISMGLSAKPTEKPTAIRDSHGGSAFNPEQLDPARRPQYDALAGLHFVTQGKRGLRRGALLEGRFAVLAGKVGKIVDLKPGWVSLWTLQSGSNDALLIEKYAEMLRLRTVPKLTRARCYPPLLDKTKESFKAAGYPLKPIEADLIARLLTLILEFANASKTGHGVIASGIYNVGGLVAEKPLVDADQAANPVLPQWVAPFIRATEKDDRIAAVPHKAIPHFAFDELLRDGMRYAFAQIEIATGEDLGSPEEIDQYMDDLLGRLHSKGKLDFNSVYLPLVMGGVLSFDRVLLHDERLPELLHQVRTLLTLRENEQDESTDLICDMTDTLIQQAVKKYGYVDKSDLQMSE